MIVGTEKVLREAGGPVKSAWSSTSNAQTGGKVVAPECARFFSRARRPQAYDSSAYWLPKTVCGIPSRKDQPREADGAVEWEKLRLEKSCAEPTVDTSDWNTD